MRSASRRSITRQPPSVPPQGGMKGKIDERRSRQRRHVTENNRSPRYPARPRFDPVSRRRVCRHPARSMCASAPRRAVSSLSELFIRYASPGVTTGLACGVDQSSHTEPSPPFTRRIVTGMNASFRFCPKYTPVCAKTPYAPPPAATSTVRRAKRRTKWRSSSRSRRPFASAPARRARDNRSPAPHAGASDRDIRRRNFERMSPPGCPRSMRRDSSLG
jgi:hypothetical protein